MLPGTIGSNPGIRVTGTETLDRADGAVVDEGLVRGIDDDLMSFVVGPRSFLSSSSTVNIGTDSPLGRVAVTADDSELFRSSSCSISSSVLAPP